MKLWLEFENYAEPCIEEPDNEYCNVQVDLQNVSYALNVWSKDFMIKEINEGTYVLPPDLIVDRLNRPCIEHAISEILKEGIMPQHLVCNEIDWLNEDLSQDTENN